MEDHAWDRITDAIESRYGIDRHGKLERKLPDAMHLTEKVSFIEFLRQGDRFRLERTSGPAIIDRRTVGAKRAGSGVRFENVYDPDETQLKTLVFRESAGEWEQVTIDAIGLG